MKQLIDFLNLYFGQKAPKLPENWKAFIVKIAPWLSVIAIVFGLPAIFALIGFSSMIPAGYGVYYGNSTLFIIFTLASLVLEGLAIPGLFKRTMAGWTFSFYAVLVSAVQNLVMMNIGGLIIGFVLGCYVLFQIRSYYTGGAPTMPAAGGPMNV